MELLKPTWKGKTVVCIASGPSLDISDVNYIRDKDCCVIAINDNYKIAPFADVLYACDLKWWDWHNGADEFKGERWTQDVKAAEKYGLNYIKSTSGHGLSTDSNVIHTGSNSGFQAINLAYHFGANKVVLIGYDMQCTGNKTHWFGDHPDNVSSRYSAWIPNFDRIREQGLIEVINCTRETALMAFPIRPLREVI